MRYNDEELIKAYHESNTLLEILQRFDLFPAGVNYKKIKEEFVRLNLPISKFWHTFNTKRAKPRKLEDLFKKDIKLTSHTFKKRLLKHGYFEHKCYKCNLTEWNNQPIPIELEHINGDRLDNRLENLTILCPNCHAQTDTYRGKNVKQFCLGKPKKIKRDRKQYADEKQIAYKNKAFKIINDNLNFVYSNARIKTLKEIANTIGVSKYYLYKFCKENKINVTKITYNRIKRDVKVNFTKEYLEKEIQLRAISSIAKEHRVSDKTVKKWCCKLGIDIKTGKFAHKNRAMKDTSLIKIIERNKIIDQTQT